MVIFPNPTIVAPGSSPVFYGGIGRIHIVLLLLFLGQIQVDADVLQREIHVVRVSVRGPADMCVVLSLPGKTTLAFRAVESPVLSWEKRNRSTRNR
jgi:hypothetical protein